MKIAIAPSTALELQTDFLAIACSDTALPDHPILTSLDQRLAGSLRRAIDDERFRAKPGQTLTMHTQQRLPATRICLLGLSASAPTQSSVFLSFAARAARLANNFGARSLALLPPASNGQFPAQVELLTTGLHLGSYRFDRYLSQEKRTVQTLTSATLLIEQAPGDLAPAIALGQVIAAAIMRARDLVNEPAAIMTPSRLAAVAAELASGSSLELTVLGPKQCRELGMGLFLAVAQGSVEEPRFIHLVWKPKNPKKRIVLIGKGVTFDSGGLSLKPNDSMLDMKTDMAGAAAVLSVMEAVAQQALPVEVHAIAACTENMPSGSSYKLGDVLRSKSGKTVEINNTDAEGRLTLADAITYALDLRPDTILDFATLTGACVVALGPHIAGVMSNDESLREQWLSAAKAAGEEMWPLPLPERLAEQLKSEIADMKNTGERWGGALTAGLFLKEFVGETPWLHVDLAGPSSADKESGHVTRGGTGFAVATIFEYLRRLSV